MNNNNDNFIFSSNTNWVSAKKSEKQYQPPLTDDATANFVWEDECKIDYVPGFNAASNILHKPVLKPVKLVVLVVRIGVNWRKTPEKEREFFESTKEKISQQLQVPDYVSVIYIPSRINDEVSFEVIKF